MENYGFVYIWRDRKHGRYYIGSHWGTADDGYVCSSSWMNRSYKRRPADFKRRIISFTNDRSILIDIEQSWLNMIKDHEVGKKYYNLKIQAIKHWHTNEESRLTVSQKISKANIGKSKNKGAYRSPEQRAKISASLMGHFQPECSPETRAKISANSKRLQAEGKIGTKGKKYSDASRAKMSQNNAMNNPIHRDKVRAAKHGIKWLQKGEIRKMAIPGTDKWTALISEGFEAI